VNIVLNMYTDYSRAKPFDFNRRCVMLDEIKEESTYSGSNAFGFNVIVDKNESKEYDLLLKNWKNFNVKMGKLEIDASIQLTTEIDVSHAKQIIESNSLGCLFIGKISEPYTCEGYSQIKPTIDFPKEFITYNKYINLDVIEIWLFNKKTGEIYSKIKPLK